MYLVGPWAIKVPRWNAHGLWSWTRGVQANLSEIEWQGTEGIAPLRRSFLGGVVNVYVRCEQWEGFGEPDYDSIAGGMERGSWFPADRKPSNIGLLNGVPVWLDYDGSWNRCPHSRNAAGLTTDED